MMNLPPTTAPYLTSVAVDNGGIIGADNSHADEVAWRRGTTTTHLSADTMSGGTTMTTTIATTTTVAKAPTGRYARLPGGHLHRAAAQAAETTSTGDTVGTPGHRRPLHPLTDGEVEAHSLQMSQRENVCVPAANAAWTRRLHARHTTCAKACGVCDAPTRTVCRGCMRPLCIRCARERARCSAVEATMPSPLVLQEIAG